MICQYCKKGELIEGTLEGVSFEPLSKTKRFLSKGVYGIKAVVCLECGRLSNLSLNTQALKKVIKK